MTLLTYNAVKETSTSTGVGAFALAGAVTGFQTFASKVANGASVPYVIRAQGSALWECGICVYNSGPNTITRSAGNVDDGSSGPGVLVNFTANTWVVFIDITADQIVQASNNGSEFNAAAFRTSLGLGSAALKSTAFFATAVDGVTLDEGGAGGSTEIAPGGVGTTQLAALAVTTAKIAANAVTSAKIDSTVAPTASPTFTGTVTVPHAVNQTDAANLSDVQSYAAQLESTAVQCATTGVLPAGTYSNGVSGVGATFTQTSAAALVIDGYTVLLNDRILVQNQASSFQNGIYTCTTLGTGVIPFILTRAFDMDQSADFGGTLITVLNGTVNGPGGTGTSNLFLCTTSNPTVGATAIVFTTVNTVTVNGAQTLTNKRIKKRITALSANSATPAIPTDSTDICVITGQSANITSFTSGLTGTPNDGDALQIRITTTGTITISWGASFGSSQTALPTGITGAATVYLGFQWNAAAALWVILGSS